MAPVQPRLIRRAFTVVEVLIVVAVIAILAGVLFPVLANARSEARKSTCLSNLHQLGSSIAMYSSDYDDHIPYSVDGFTLATDLLNPSSTDLDVVILSTMPRFEVVVQPYAKSVQILACPAEHRFEYNIEGDVNYFRTYGSSYSYAIYPAYMKWTIEDFSVPTQQYIASDIAPWHGGSDATSFRINELFADFHVKNVSWSDYLQSVVPYGLE